MMNPNETLDPNDVLQDIRQQVSQRFDDGQETSTDVDFAILDEWLSNGGFLPDAWKVQPVDAVRKVHPA
jgi:hypothetical protein